MVGFILTGLLATLASITFSWLFSLEDIDDKFWLHHPHRRDGVLRRLKAISPDDAENPVQFWKPILEGFVLNLSDQQLITGIVLVIISFPKYLNMNRVDVDRKNLGI